MIDDFVVFILTHGRPDNVKTFSNLRKQGYTGPIYLVIDDEDKTAEQYRANFGDDAVLQFSKDAIGKTFDKGGVFGSRGSPVYARNACFDLARSIGVRYFIQLDDDYHDFEIVHEPQVGKSFCKIKNLDRTLQIMLDYFKAIPALSIAMGQGGDFLGGGASTTCKDIKTFRKAMNSFMCDTERQFEFVALMNDDVTTYVTHGNRGGLFLTILMLCLHQPTTQQAAGGITELYLDQGTFIKSFYTIMFAPSCVKIGMMGTAHPRLHHAIRWNNAVPKILHERYRRSPQQ